MTLLKCIDDFVEKISVTDKQEESVKKSYSNIKSHLEDSDSNLSIEEVFQNGSYARDTIILPLPLDIDIFAVIEKEQNMNSAKLPDPQSILSKIKRVLEGITAYEGKVSQDRPCVTVTLSDKVFDVLPAYRFVGGYFYIPNEDLESWQLVPDPDTHTKELNKVNADRNYLVKKVIKAVKHWNRRQKYPFLSIEIEQIAIKVFRVNDFSNLEEGIRKWYTNAALNLGATVLKTWQLQQDLVNGVKEKLIEANGYNKNNEEGKAKKIWKKVFGDDFNIGDVNEAKSNSKALSDGSLKYSSIFGLSTSKGKDIPASSGFFGEVDV
jgi:hypothetical protein